MSGVQAGRGRKRHSRQRSGVKNLHERAVLGGAIGDIWGRGVAGKLGKHAGLLLKGVGAPPEGGSGASEGLMGGESTNQRRFQ